MNPLLEPAVLTDALLVTKGAAAPSRFRRARSGLSSRVASEDGKSRISLRLDEEQMCRMRLAAAHRGKSGQGLLEAALEHYLDKVMPGLLDGPCPCLARGTRASEPCADGCIVVRPLDPP